MPQTQSVFLQQRTRKFSYSFAVDGGAIGNITLRGGTIPAGAIVIGTTTRQTANFTSAGAATIGVGLEVAGDLQTPLAYNLITGVATYSEGINATAGSGCLAMSSGQASYGIPATVETTAERSVVMAVAGAALTGGAADIYITTLEP